MINARTVTTNDCIDSRGIIITTKRNNKNNHALTEGITTYETLRDLDISFPFGIFNFLKSQFQMLFNFIFLHRWFDTRMSNYDLCGAYLWADAGWVIRVVVVTVAIPNVNDAMIIVMKNNLVFVIILRVIWHIFYKEYCIGILKDQLR